MIEGTAPIVIKDNNNMFKVDRGFKPPPIHPRIIAMIYSKDNIEFITPNPYFDKNNIPDTASLSEDDITEIKYNDYNFRGVIFNNREHKVLLLANVDSEI